MDAICSGIVVYDGGDIVFGAKRSNQWMQYTVRSVQWNSDIWWWRHYLGAKRSNQWMQYAVDAVE